MNSTKATDIKREWHLIDLRGKVLGRVATEIATLLMGKKKSYYVSHLDCGDHVVVTNAQEVVATGKKDEQKEYFRYSGYPGGLRRETMGKLRVRKPEDIIKHAVKGMLPQNKLRDEMLKRLHIFTEAEHTYSDKFSKN